MLDELKELRRLIGKLMGYERTDALALIDQLVERFSANTQTIEALTKSNIDLKIPCGTTEYHRRLLFKANPVKQQDERPGYICLLPEILENEKACQLIAENVRFDEDIFRPEHVLWGEWLLLFGYSKQFLFVQADSEHIV